MTLKHLRRGKTFVSTGKVDVPGASTSGLGWYVVQRGSDRVLYYLTGENPEREDQISLTSEEFARLETAEEDDAQKIVTSIVNDRYNTRHGLT